MILMCFWWQRAVSLLQSWIYIRALLLSHAQSLSPSSFHKTKSKSLFVVKNSCVCWGVWKMMRRILKTFVVWFSFSFSFFVLLFFLFSRCSRCLTTCWTLLPRNYMVVFWGGAVNGEFLFSKIWEKIFTPKQKHQRKIIHREIIHISPIVSLSLCTLRAPVVSSSLLINARNTRAQIRVWYIITRARTCLHSRWRRRLPLPAPRWMMNASRRGEGR